MTDERIALEYLLTFFFVVLISTLARWAIYNASQGEFKNEKLYVNQIV